MKPARIRDILHASDGRLLHKSTIQKLIHHYNDVGHCQKKVRRCTTIQKVTSEVIDVIEEVLMDDKKVATAEY